MIIFNRVCALASIAVVGLALTACKPETIETSSSISDQSYEADWDAIASWPGEIADDAEAEPNPKMVTTVLVLDDSGSMGSDIHAAKTAVIDTINGLPSPAKVAVIGLNSGEILPTTDILDAKARISAALETVTANGGTPLGGSMKQAYALLTEEASRQRGFGVYRIIVTTDGKAGDEGTLRKNTAYILRNTPIQISTIGLGIGTGHPLNLPGRTTYAAIDNVSDLAAALKAVSAEQASFEPMSNFQAVN